MAVRVGFAGTNAWAAQALERLVAVPGLELALVLSQPDRPAGRGRKAAAPPVALAARELGLELAQPERAGRGPAAAAAARADGRRGRRLRRARAARAARRAALRQPASLRAPALARRRPDRARADGRRRRERRRGDAARRGARRRARWPRSSASRSGPTTTPGAVYARALELGARAASRARSPTRRAGGSRPCRRSGSRPTPPRSPPPTARSTRRRPARELHDRVRALSPHIGARLALDGAPHTIWRTRRARGRARRRAPWSATATRCVLGCGDGALEISSCSRRAGAACRPPTGCAACAARCPRRRPA